MRRREYIVGSGIVLVALSAGCLGNGSDESATEGGGSDNENCDSIRTLEVHPAIEVPDGEPKLDAREAGLLEVDPIEQVLEQAYQEDSDELRERIDSSEQDDPDSRLAEIRISSAEKDTVQQHLGGLTYLNYRGRDYVLIHLMTVC